MIGNNIKKFIKKKCLTHLELLRKHYKEYKPKEWLFEGQKGGRYRRNMSTCRHTQTLYNIKKI